MKLIVTAPLVLVLDPPRPVARVVADIDHAAVTRVAAVLSGKRAHRAVRADVGRFSARRRQPGKPSATA